jgi:hypothetical protein
MESWHWCHLGVLFILVYCPGACAVVRCCIALSFFFVSDISDGIRAGISADKNIVGDRMVHRCGVTFGISVLFAGTR